MRSGKIWRFLEAYAGVARLILRELRAIVRIGAGAVAVAIHAIEMQIRTVDRPQQVLDGHDGRSRTHSYNSK
jgi:hypothetical protein